MSLKLDGTGKITGIDQGLNVVGVGTFSTDLSAGGNVVISGDVVVGGGLTVTGVLTYEDVTNVDSIGIITARSGIVGDLTGNVTGNVTGDITGNIIGSPTLSGISSSITDTAVDIFVYDTSKDSDGGAWRKRTQHTSWYNETLNTATRGSRREFPAVAVLVLEGTQVTIYDGDDPDLPMWMVFDRASSAGWTPNTTNILGVSYSTFTSISMLNGIFAMGADYDSDNTNGVLIKVSFIEDTGYFHGVNSVSSSYPAGGFGRYRGSIAERDSGKGHVNINDTDKIVNVHVNDVAMTVLPSAPIDSATGLPVPTIAVATDGGVSVIKDDGTVVDYTRGGNEYTGSVSFDEGNNLFITWGTDAGGYRHVTRLTNPYADNTTFDVTYGYVASDAGLGAAAAGGTAGVVKISNNARHFAIQPSISNSGIDRNNYDDRIALLDLDGSTTSNSLVAFATTSYNTGWMQGNVRRALLCSTDSNDVSDVTQTATNFATGFTFDNTGRLTSHTYTDGATSWQMVDGSVGAAGYVQLNALGLTSGKSYEVAMTVDNHQAFNDGSPYITRYDAVTGGVTTPYYFTEWDLTSASAITLKATIVAEDDTSEFVIYCANSATINVTNFTVTEVVEKDRSPQGYGLNVFGTVTKSPVATGAELVAYSGFSGSNCFRQTYSAELDPGTGDYSFMCWFKCPATTAEQIYMRRFSNVSVTGGTMLRLVATTSVIQWYVRDTSTTSTAVNSTSALDDDQWHFIVGTREGGTAKLYVDGQLDATSGCSANSHNPGFTACLMIGAEETVGSPGNFQNAADLSSLTLVRYSLSAPTAAQVKKMYEDEKVLFQENAKCTLYGSSGTVNALAYDEVTDRLHVGTSSGRSDFQGLRRINNTTTAVTTAISAHDEFIAEQ